MVVHLGVGYEYQDSKKSSNQWVGAVQTNTYIMQSHDCVRFTHLHYSAFLKNIKAAFRGTRMLWGLKGQVSDRKSFFGFIWVQNWSQMAGKIYLCIIYDNHALGKQNNSICACMLISYPYTSLPKLQYGMSTVPASKRHYEIIKHGEDGGHCQYKMT